MATNRPRSRARSARRGDIAPPQSADDYFLLDNTPASERVPREVASLAARRLEVHVPGKGFDPSKLAKSREARGVWELELPEGAALGLPGRDYGRMTHAAVTRGTKGTVDSEPHKPDWVDFIPHPKLAPPFAARAMQRVNGSPINPHYGVFGPDDRQVYYPSGYPWTCIGRIFVWNDFSQPNWAWSGSGVLIGGRVVLTAGHMAPWGSNNWAMLFVPAYYNGSSTLGIGVSSWVSDYWGYNIGHVSAWDMVVLRLYTPLGGSYGYFGAKTYSSSWEGGDYWTLAGYPGAVAGANRPSRQMWWPIVDDDSDGSADELEYYADASPGDSGGPVFGFWSGWPYSVGTHSGGEKETFLWWTIEDDNASAGGAAMVDLIKWARSNWP
jgi:V8-like Glu-specific endopeptidase